MSEKWFWSYAEDGDQWWGACDTKEEAAALAFTDPNIENVAWLNTGRAIDPAEFLDSEWLFEHIADAHDDESPLEESWKSFWGVKSEDFAELDAAFREAFHAWAAKRKLPEWHVIEGIAERVQRPIPARTGGKE